jgi:hypothetical protein
MMTKLTNSITEEITNKKVIGVARCDDQHPQGLTPAIVYGGAEAHHKNKPFKVLDNARTHPHSSHSNQYELNQATIEDGAYNAEAGMLELHHEDGPPKRWWNRKPLMLIVGGALLVAVVILAVTLTKQRNEKQSDSVIAGMTGEDLPSGEDGQDAENIIYGSVTNTVSFYAVWYNIVKYPYLQTPLTKQSGTTLNMNTTNEVTGDIVRTI